MHRLPTNLKEALDALRAGAHKQVSHIRRTIRACRDTGRQTKERLIDGYTTEEIWNLSDAMVTWLLPRLTEFRRRCPHSLVEGMSNEEWDEVLGDMIYFLRNFDMPGVADKGRCERGAELFNKYWPTLWI